MDDIETIILLQLVSRMVSEGINLKGHNDILVT